MVARYGEFVRYRPSFTGATALLWLAPVLLLMIGIAVAVAAARARRSRVEQSALLNADDEQSLRELLAKTENDS